MLLGTGFCFEALIHSGEAKPWKGTEQNGEDELDPCISGAKHFRILSIWLPPAANEAPEGRGTGGIDMHSCLGFGVWLPSPFHSFTLFMMSLRSARYCSRSCGSICWLDRVGKARLHLDSSAGLRRYVVKGGSWV